MSFLIEDFPLVSIVIPVYNGANYLKEAIDSACNQTYRNCEIIVVNDGSTDGGKSEQIALSYGDKIRYFYKENGKVSSALNLGIRKMRGEYFAWLSHDDLFYPEKIERQMETMLRTGADIVAAGCNYFTDGGNQIPFCPTKFYDSQLLETGVFSVIHGMIQFGGILLHKRVFEKYGTFREDLFTVQDYEFLFRVLKNERCVFTGDIVNGVRCHASQVGKTSEYMEKERDKMYEMFMEKLTDEEQIRLYGSSYNFYYQILIRLMSLPYTAESLLLCMKKLCQTKEERVHVEKEEKVLIYGAGKCGRTFLFDLRCRGIDVEGFLDKNQALKGKMIDGIICYSLDEAKELAFGRKIVIASEYRADMAKMLESVGIQRYLYREDYEREYGMLQTSPPKDVVLKWVRTYQQNGWKK